MTELTKEQILNSVADMKVSDLVELTKMMEDKFGVSGDRISGVPEVIYDEISAEPSIVSIVMVSYGDKLINVVKEIRAITGAGLKESMAIAKESDTIKSDIERPEAEEIKKKIEEAGGKVEIK